MRHVLQMQSESALPENIALRPNARQKIHIMKRQSSRADARRGGHHPSAFRKVTFVPYPIAYQRDRFVERCRERKSLRSGESRRLQALVNRDPGCVQFEQVARKPVRRSVTNGCCRAAAGARAEKFCSRHAAQSATNNPGTRENSRVLSVTSVAARRRAWAAMR